VKKLLARVVRIPADAGVVKTSGGIPPEVFTPA